MHRIKKLSGLLFMLPHFRNMERYLKCFFGFCSDCFIHHSNGEVKQGTLAADCSSRRNTLHKQLKLGEEKLIVMADEQWACRKDSSTRPEATHKCDLCNRDCHSQIGLYSDRRRCSNWADSLEVSAHDRPWPTGASQGRDCKTPLTSLAQCHFFYSFPYCKISVINSCLTVYLQIVMLLLGRNAQPELPDCEGRYTPFLCIILSKQLYTAVVLQCECHIIKHHYAWHDVARPCSKI